MPSVTDHIRPELARLLPASVLVEVTCFVFYDHHPRDQKQIDIIIGTSKGEIKEYYKRSLVNSLNLCGSYIPLDLKILRNENSDLYYLVVCGDDLTILSRKERPAIQSSVKNVQNYSIEDSSCRGQAELKVIVKDDAVPLVFDDNYQNLNERATTMNGLRADDSLPVLRELMRKLIEAKYNVKCNENTLKELMSLRQVTALSAYQGIHPNTEDSTFKANSSKVSDVVKVKSLDPWVKICNKKIVIALIISYNNSTIPIEDVHILLHGSDKKTMVYTTRLYVKTNTPPGWMLRNSNKLLNDNEIAVVAVVDMDEIAKNYLCKINFNGVIAYRRLGKDCLMPFNNVTLTSVDTMAESFDALAACNTGEMLCLAIVATTIRTELHLKHMRVPSEPPLTIPDSFSTHLQMEKSDSARNTLIYRKSPYHIVNGTMLVFSDNTIVNDWYIVFAYTISPSQLILLIHYIHDAMPHTILASTPNHKVSLAAFKQTEELQNVTVDYKKYALSLIKQNDLLLEYFDKCMARMSESKDTEIRAKIGTEIDLFAGGVHSFMEFRTKMLEEALVGAKGLHIDGECQDPVSDVNMALN